MTTFNTGNPIGSTDARDRSDNSENLDFAVNSLEQTFVDRFGVTRDTLEGIYQKSAYYRAGTFDAGYTLTNNRQTLAYGNVEYSWSGTFPKVVSAGSTPATSGGVGAGAWVDRTDVVLRDQVNLMRGELLDGVVYPSYLGDFILASSVIPVGVTHIRTQYGLLYAWDQLFSGQSHTVISTPVYNGVGGYDLATDKGIFEFVSLSNKDLRINNDISGYGVDVTGDAINDLQMQKIAQNTETLNIKSGQVIRVSSIPESFNRFSGGGKLIYENDSIGILEYNMPDYFEINDFQIETIYRNSLAIKANYMNLINVKEWQSDSRTEPARYNAVEWRSDTEITVNNHATYNTGARFIATSVDCSLSINGITTRVDHVGEGPNGNLHGTDGIKISGKMRSVNISNHKCFGTSRDLIDTFIGGGELNISNVWADGFYFDQIEIKSEGTAAVSADETPHDINISNIFCRPGGLGSHDTFAAVVLYNQSEGDNNTSPRRINISNYNARRIGLAATGVYYGIRVLGSFDININNSNILQAKDHGINATRCKNVKIANSNIHGVLRGVSINNCDTLKISSSNIGVDTQSGDVSSSALVFGGTTNNVKVASSDLVGLTKSLTGEGATINNAKVTGCNLTAQCRIDTFTDFEFNNTNIDALSNPAGTIDCILSGAETPSAKLKFIGGKLSNARRGINLQSLSLMTCIGATFENTQAPFGGTVTDNNKVIIGCISNGGGAFPVAAGNDQIANNIAV